MVSDVLFSASLSVLSVRACRRVWKLIYDGTMLVLL